MSEIEGYSDHAIQYYREHGGMFAFHLAMAVLTGGVWLFMWAGYLVGRMIRGDWKEVQ